MKVHELKCWRGPFQAVVDGSKRYEIRQDDRHFLVGDELNLREWDPSGGYTASGDYTENKPTYGPGAYTGREWRGTITYKSEGGTWGLPQTVCVLSIAEVKTK